MVWFAKQSTGISTAVSATACKQISAQHGLSCTFNLWLTSKVCLSKLIKPLPPKKGQNIVFLVKMDILWNYHLKLMYTMLFPSSKIILNLFKQIIVCFLNDASKFSKGVQFHRILWRGCQSTQLRYATGVTCTSSYAIKQEPANECWNILRFVALAGQSACNTLLILKSKHALTCFAGTATFSAADESRRSLASYPLPFLKFGRSSAS